VAEGGVNGAGGIYAVRISVSRYESHVVAIRDQEPKFGLTGGKNHLLQLGKQTMATPKLITPNRAYPNIQQVK
jgi:hypothetical protein